MGGSDGGGASLIEDEGSFWVKVEIKSVLEPLCPCRSAVLVEHVHPIVRNG